MILGAGDHRAQIQGHDLLVFQGFRHVAADNAARQAFHNGGFADPGFANQHRVVLGSAGQYLHDAPDLVVAADDGIDFAGARQGGEIAAVFLECLEFILGILVGDPLIAPQVGQGLENGVAFKPMRRP